MKFKSSGHRIIEAASWEEAAATFALMKARMQYGKRKCAVRTCRIESVYQDGSAAECVAFIGRADGEGIIGREVRFTVRKEA